MDKKSKYIIFYYDSNSDIFYIRDKETLEEYEVNGDRIFDFLEEYNTDIETDVLISNNGDEFLAELIPYLRN